jgi:hypothetical protein
VASSAKPKVRFMNSSEIVLWCSIMLGIPNC